MVIQNNRKISPQEGAQSLPVDTSVLFGYFGKNDVRPKAEECSLS